MWSVPVYNDFTKTNIFFIDAAVSSSNVEVYEACMAVLSSISASFLILS